jgi:chromosomal replication initiation ATPase DnaA
MNYTELDLIKIHSLSTKGFSFEESLKSIRLDKSSGYNNDDLEILINVVCDYYSISIDDIKRKVRTMDILNARRIFCYLSRVLTSNSLKFIGRRVNLDHSTVLHQFKKVNDWIDIKDKQIIKEVDEITIEYNKSLKLIKKNVH